MSLPVTQVLIKVPASLTKAQRLELADLIVEHIVDRTQRGKNINGGKFPAYSKDYIKSLDFKNAGKSKSKVDLTLSGDMLAALKLVEESKGELVIGYDKGAPEAGRAEGNILGSYGGEPNPKRARDFLGIDATKLKQLIKYVADTNV